MIVLRKLFSEITTINDIDSSKRGELIGTGIVGGVGTLGAAGLSGKLERYNSGKIESLKARKVFKKGINDLSKERNIKDKTAILERARKQNKASSSIYDMLFLNRNNKKYDKELENSLLNNKKEFNTKVGKLKQAIRASKKANINAKVRNTKLKVLGLGSLITTGALANKGLRKDKN